MTYQITQVDLAGCETSVLRHEDFVHVCEQIVVYRRARPEYIFYIANPDNADIGRPDGLTNEEQELLP